MNADLGLYSPNLHDPPHPARLVHPVEHVCHARNSRTNNERRVALVPPVERGRGVDDALHAGKGRVVRACLVISYISQTVERTADMSGTMAASTSCPGNKSRTCAALGSDRAVMRTLYPESRSAETM